jgi:hypothetical protein
MTRSILSRAFLSAVLFVLLAGAGRAQLHRDDENEMNAITERCIRMVETERGKLAVMWMSREFWAYAVEQTAYAGSDQADELLERLAEYEMFVVVYMPDGGFRNTSMREVDLETLNLVDGRGEELEALDEDEVNEDVVSLADMMSSAIFSQMERAGGRVRVVFFSTNEVNGGRGLDPDHNGAFHVTVGEYRLSWRRGTAMLDRDDTRRDDRASVNVSGDDRPVSRTGGRSVARSGDARWTLRDPRSGGTSGSNDWTLRGTNRTARRSR